MDGSQVRDNIIDPNVPKEFLQSMQLDRAEFLIVEESQTVRVAIGGVWTNQTIGDVWQKINHALTKLVAQYPQIRVDCRFVRDSDVSGAWSIRTLVANLENQGVEVDFLADETMDAVFKNIDRHRQKIDAAAKQDHDSGVSGALSFLGQLVTQNLKDVYRGLNLFGAVMVWFVTFGKPGGLRPRSIATHINKMGIGAIPVVAFSCFLVGGVIAQQAAYQLRWFGAETLAVDLSSYMIFRELAVLIAAIMVAGRTASSIAAELGAMKMREEVDALHVMGIDPISVLVAPRLVALVIILPLLTVIACFFSIMGAATLINLYSGFGYELYFARMRDFVGADTIISGLIKAPFMAIAIGIVGCVEGLKVGGSTESLGHHTTSAVVKAVFAVFLIDGFFAMFFAALEFG